MGGGLSGFSTLNGYELKASETEKEMTKSVRAVEKYLVWNVEVHLVPLARSVDSLADRQFAKYRIEEKKSPLLRFKSIQKRPFVLRWSVPILKQQEEHAHTSFPFPMPK